MDAETSCCGMLFAATLPGGVILACVVLEGGEEEEEKGAEHCGTCAAGSVERAGGTDMFCDIPLLYVSSICAVCHPLNIGMVNYSR